MIGVLVVSGIQTGFDYCQLTQLMNASCQCIAWINGVVFEKEKKKSVMNA